MLRNKFYDSLKKILFAFVAIMFVVPAFSATLPAGYTELEYIASNGTQYIDTGIQANLDTKLEIDFALLSNNGNTNIGIYGAAGDNQNSSAFVLTTNTGRSYIFPQLDSVSRTIVANLNFVLGKKYHSVQSKDGWYYDGTLGATWSNPTAFTTPRSMILFGSRGGGESGADTLKSSAQVWTVKIWNGSTLVRNFVPAQTIINNETVNGMYDTVGNQFYRSATDGTNFAAGPAKCRNLLDISKVTTGKIIKNPTGEIVDNVNYAVSDKLYLPNGTYTFSQTNSATGSSVVADAYSYDSNDNPLNLIYIVYGTETLQKTFTLSGDYSYIRIAYRNATASNVQLEQGSTATDYVPYCASTGEIKIATTKYNEDAFANLVTTLNSAITKVTNIVDTTVAQASSIGTLATTKQDRPADGDCPAGRKCLLVTGTDGKPHWYLIQE